MSAPTHLFSLFLSPSLLLKHTHTRARTQESVVPGNLMTRQRKPQVPKKKSQSLRLLALAPFSCVRRPFSAGAPIPTTPPTQPPHPPASNLAIMSSHRPFRPVSLPLYFQPFVKRRKEKRAGRHIKRSRGCQSLPESDVTDKQSSRAVTVGRSPPSVSRDSPVRLIR